MHCRLQAGRPVELTGPIPRRSSSVLGIFLHAEAGRHRLAIRIRHDRASRRWIAGDGSGTIPVTLVKDSLLRDVRLTPVYR